MLQKKQLTMTQTLSKLKHQQADLVRALELLKKNEEIKTSLTLKIKLVIKL